MFRIRFKFTYTSYTVIFLYIAVNDNTSERHIIDLKNIRNGFQRLHYIKVSLKRILRKKTVPGTKGIFVSATKE